MDELDDNRQTQDAHSEHELADGAGEITKTRHLSGLYENWFLDYASYVILERAVPDVYDGLKPVQRRILHAMKELDDGRYNKVANIIGHTMKYHPHGDASIGDALVQLGQKDLLIDTQGNWGNILTGDGAAAPRYIEARLSKFALEVVFNPKISSWRASYDGRSKEPVRLPVKFPLLLAQGVEGIAVGLASKILPHNFNELIEGAIRILQGQDFKILPDFPTGGLADFSRYNNGLRGGRVRIRARINQKDKRTLVISELPYGTTTPALIDSIISANDKGKIKIRKIDDNTAEQVEVLVHLAAGVSPDTTIDALYAFTDCEVPVSPNSCVIIDDKPRFMDVKEILTITTHNTRDLLEKELQIRRLELQEELLFASLEKIFIEKKIYRKIEECLTWESVIEIIDKALTPYKKGFFRPVTVDDITSLTEIKIKRISKYNSQKADEAIKELTTEFEEVENHLAHLTDYTINYFRQIQKKYGSSFPRRTEIRNFDTIEAAMVAAATQKLYVNREQGFAGTGLKKDEYLCDCSDIDDMIIFRGDGTFIVTKVADKVFVGQHVIHIDIFKKNDDRTIYNLIYQDGKKGGVYAKRFPVVGVMRDKEYVFTKGNEGSRVLYFTGNPNGEAEVVKVHFRPKPRMKVHTIDFDFSQMAIKGRGAKGNLVTHKAVRKIVKGEEGVSTLGAIDVWYDDTVRRLNYDGRGQYLGAFSGDDRILTVYQTGVYRINGYDISTHFEENMLSIRKYDPEEIVTAIYIEADSQTPYVKRFQAEISPRKTNFIGDDPKARLLSVSFAPMPVIEIIFMPNPRRKTEQEVISAAEFIGVKSYKARGKRLTTSVYREIQFIEDQDDVPEMNAFEPVDEAGVPAEEEPLSGESATMAAVESSKEDQLAEDNTDDQKVGAEDNPSSDERKKWEDSGQMEIEF